MTAHNIGIVPREPKLHVMARDTFVNDDGTRVALAGSFEVTGIVTRFRRPAGAFLRQSRRAGEIIELRKITKAGKIRWNRANRVMRKVLRHAEDFLASQEAANRAFHIVGSL